jgi:branched-chain amino acid transport system substrate-binding protein
MEIERTLARLAMLGATLLLASTLPAPPAAAQAQQPIRIGASISQTGSFAQLGQNQLRGYQLCVKHANEKGGVLGRRIELLVEDDKSQGSDAAAIYEKLIAQTKVDAVLGPYSSPVTEAVTAVTEKHKMPMLAPGAATTSVFKQGRRFVFMVLSPAEFYLEGLLDVAAKRGLKTVALIHEDTLFPKATAQGSVDLAKRKGMQVVLVAPYPKGTTDFNALVGKLREAKPDVVAAATYFDDAVAITRKLQELDLNPKMFGVTVGGDLPKFHDTLGAAAEFVYGATQWEPELVTLRAGGLIPVARQYPGAKEFVEAYRKEYPNADFSYHSAAGYSGCEVLIEAIRRAGSVDGEKVRAEILKFDANTVFGGFRLDKDGFQIGHKMLLFQWQDGKKAIVWPEELAPGTPRFPTPPWKQRT